MTLQDFKDYLGSPTNTKITDNNLPKWENLLEKIIEKFKSFYNKENIDSAKELIDFINKWKVEEENNLETTVLDNNGRGRAILNHIAKALKATTSQQNEIRDMLKPYKRSKKSGVTKSIISSSASISKESISDKAKELMQILKNAHNIILHGAPGTGKTYLAHEIAREMGCDENRIKMVQFHPSYDYTDFMEGLRPKNEAGNIGFERKDGAFKAFCKKALLNGPGDKKESEESENNQIMMNKEVDSPKYVFIIDEINRGEIAKILGECMFSIDPGYSGDGHKIDTQYQNLITASEDPFKDGFFRPNNVFIIGTMNDIDRGVESMDLAMRRRFVFVEIKAEDTQEKILEKLSAEDKVIAKNAMDKLNENIREKEGLGEDYCIGASYFLKVNNYDSQDKWKLLWNYHLNGLLKEYLRGREDAENSLSELHTIYKNAIENKGEQVKEDEAIDTENEIIEA